MNAKKIAIGTFAGTLAVTLFGWISFRGSESALAELHSDIDRDVVIKAHRKFARDILTSRIDVDGMTDDQLDEIFMQQYIPKFL